MCAPPIFVNFLRTWLDKIIEHMTIYTQRYIYITISIFTFVRPCIRVFITLYSFVTFEVPGASSDRCCSKDIPAKPGYLVQSTDIRDLQLSRAIISLVRFWVADKSWYDGLGCKDFETLKVQPCVMWLWQPINNWLEYDTFGITCF